MKRDAFRRISGFFSTMNRAAPGNYGLKDVITALYWVQENIHNFGGNPESVTAIGSSAGAVMVHMLALSSKSEGLFHRYILHGGSALGPWALHFQQEIKQLYKEVAKLAGCLPTGIDNANKTIFDANLWEENRQCDVPHTSDDDLKQDEEMMKCMRTVDTDVLLRLRRKFVSVGDILVSSLHNRAVLYFVLLLSLLLSVRLAGASVLLNLSCIGGGVRRRRCDDASAEDHQEPIVSRYTGDISSHKGRGSGEVDR